MPMQKIQADLFRKMMLLGAQNLEKNRAAVDALNVFPVPDGDTGTNMNLTLQAVVRAVNQVGEPDVGKLAAACATGSLMGARGNSGVILSQLFRGFGRHLEDKTEITAADLAQALQVGVDTVYKAVRKPVEGTMLTVMRESAQAAISAAEQQNELLPTLEAVVAQAESTVAKTPELLPVLKKAGVVDAGGQGLLMIFQGWLAAAQGKDIDVLSEQSTVVDTVAPEVADAIEFGYCTEFLIRAPSTNEDELHERLDSLGDSLLVVGDARLLKVHVHTNDPGKALQIGLEYGQLTGIKIENMREQHTAQYFDMDARDQQFKPLGVVAVAAGSGFEDIFRSIGVDVVVTGGQTMNPSTEDLARGVDLVAAEQVIILPNNNNIIMTAEQVSEISDKIVHVIPTASLPEGLAAMMSYMGETDDLNQMLANMERNTQHVQSGQVTVAVRDHDSEIGSISEGEFIGIRGKDTIVAYGDDMAQVVYALVAKMVDDESGLLSIFYGADVKLSEAESISAQLAEIYPDLEIELREGGQPIYHYILSVE